MSSDLDQDVCDLLNVVGSGHMSSLAYDTAWVARLGEIDWHLSNKALNWLCEHQLMDGSWGAEQPFYYHDRIISTLAAMIALTYRGRRGHDKTQIEKGLLALERITGGATQGLQADPNGATVGFEMIIPTLVAEAERLGIVKQQGNRILGRMKNLRDKKMAKLAGIKINRYFTPAFSVEMAGTDGQNILDIDNLQEKNGSVANSPSATAYYISHVKLAEKTALKYLEDIVDEKGGAPFAAPFDIFERAWVLWNLVITEHSNQEIEQYCEPHVEYLHKAWRAGKGVGFSVTYSPTDCDDTSLVFDILTRYKRNVDLEAILSYEEESYFRCYPLEANSSVSVNIHVLGALKQAGFDKEHPSVKKIITYLRLNRQDEQYWQDKWHISPYYPTSHAVISCEDYDNALCDGAINWILKTQKADGSWGAYETSTAEETAYCLQALQLWNKHKGRIPKEKIDLGVLWLQNNLDKPYPPLWIGKVLYCPRYVTQSVIYSALLMAQG